MTETGELHDAIPRIKSEQVKVTVAFDLFQPAGFGVGVTTGATVGGTAKLRS